MSPAPTERRGRPLIALTGVVVAWIALRVAMFDPQFPAMSEPSRLPAASSSPVGTLPGRAEEHRAPELAASEAPPVADAARGFLAPFSVRSPVAQHDAVISRPPRPALPAEQLVAGSGMLERPSTMERRQPPATPPPAMALPSKSLPMSSLAGPALSRWSGDAWLVVRPGNSGASRLGGVVPTYGASQAGAVLRYTLASGSGHRPAVYLRAVQALSGARDSDAAIGVTARLVPALPVAAHVEARATSRASGTDLRPAVFLSAGGERNGLVAGFAARGYAQAGYVGGRDATAFADGSIVADRRLWSGSGATATAGLGAWGGAQRGAARLDLGPTAGVVLRVGKASARLSVDYRLRVAGDASPSSGPALTLSGGF